MKESKSMMRKEVAFMKKKGAPKSMIRHEEKEAGMKKGVKKMAFGGMSGGTFGGMKQQVEPTREPRGRALMRPVGPVSPGMYKKGGSVGSFRKAADGIASKGKTKGKMVRMNYGGKC